MKDRIERFIAGTELQSEDYDWFFITLFQGALNPAQIAAILISLRIHGENKAALLAGAKAMRSAALKPNLTALGNIYLADNCGTGGDGTASFNISTASAIVAASLGVAMAKHGNRSVSSKCGSADLLFAAGYPDSLTAAASVKLLQEFNFAFFFAPHFHPVMRHVMPVRKELGIRTIFNLLGPLANPLAPRTQLLGVSHRKYIEPMAATLAELGIERAYVVHSRDGMDEISPCAITDAMFVNGRQCQAMTIDPNDFGFKGHANELTGGDSTLNLQLLQDLLAGKEDTIAEAVYLNTAAVLFLNNRAQDLADGVAKARNALQSGQAKTYFTKFIHRAQELKHG